MTERIAVPASDQSAQGSGATRRVCDTVPMAVISTCEWTVSACFRAPTLRAEVCQSIYVLEFGERVYGRNSRAAARGGLRTISALSTRGISALVPRWRKQTKHLIRLQQLHTTAI